MLVGVVLDNVKFNCGMEKLKCVRMLLLGWLGLLVNVKDNLLRFGCRCVGRDCR